MSVYPHFKLISPMHVHNLNTSHPAHKHKTANQKTGLLTSGSLFLTSLIILTESSSSSISSGMGGKTGS